MAAVAQQKNVRLSDSAYTSCLLACRPDLSRAATEDACDVLQAVCELLYQLTSAHPGLVASRAPLLVQGVEFVASELCPRSSQELARSPEEQAALVATANKLGRVVRELVQLGPLTELLAPYLIADVLLQFQRTTLDHYVQESLTRSLYCLLTQCRDEVVTRLRVTLPPATQHLFHTLFVNYKKFYKFAGRV
ncbi:uncharacterized protein LOC119104811 [Pollicipes pollicipes]|uniref:uncharacterized protein LOC119104811 n=1 Tax=Pollicipes pollicipes TaxID=41117 RepID=UPI0018852C4B|nr:uncharacterized protein LOC119104811 [Pollicipes pollicipes]